MRTRDEKSGWRLATAASVLAVLALAGATAGCGGEDGGTTAGELSAEELGRLGGRIHAEPERADELLAEAGLTAEELEARVREVTADPEASREYAEAFREVAGEAPADGS